MLVWPQNLRRFWNKLCESAACTLSPGQTDSQVDVSQRKFANPELAYGLAKGGQMDSQVSSQVAKSRKFHAYHWLMRFYNNRLLAINLCRNLARPKLTQVHASRRKWLAKRNASPKLASPFDQGFSQYTANKKLDILYSAQHGNQHKDAFTWIIYHDPCC